MRIVAHAACRASCRRAAIDAVPRGFDALLGRAERQTHAGEYVRGLLLDGERKSIAPLTARVPGAVVQALRPFVNQSPWEWAPLRAASRFALRCQRREQWASSWGIEATISTSRPTTH